MAQAFPKGERRGRRRAGDLWTSALGMHSLTPAGPCRTPDVLGTSPAAAPQHQGSPTNPNGDKTLLAHHHPQPLSHGLVPTCLLDVGHSRGDGCFLAQPTGIFRKHPKGVGIANDEVRDGAAGAGAALQHREPFLGEKKKSGEERQVVQRMEKVWGETGVCSSPFPIRASSASGHGGPGACRLTPLFLSDFCTT